MCNAYLFMFSSWKGLLGERSRNAIHFILFRNISWKRTTTVMKYDTIYVIKLLLPITLNQSQIEYPMRGRWQKYAMHAMITDEHERLWDEAIKDGLSMLFKGLWHNCAAVFKNSINASHFCICNTTWGQGRVDAKIPGHEFLPQSKHFVVINFQNLSLSRKTRKKLENSSN